LRGQKALQTAGRLGVAFLLLLSDVDAVERDSGTSWTAGSTRPHREKLRRMGSESGSMAPNLEAACRFVERTGGIAAIGALGGGPGLLCAEAGDSRRLPRQD
jgi:carbamate kinase